MSIKASDFHVVQVGESSYVYHRDSFSLAKVGHELPQWLKEIADEPNLSEENKDRLQNLEEAFSKNKDSVTRHPESGRVLYLNISNACNLDCLYCYADGGSYKSAPGYMTVQEAKKSIQAFYEKLGGIDVICFFGGEPLLNARVIPELCDFARQLAKQRKLTPPRFSMVTNGTLVTEAIADMLSEREFSVTLSLDGPEDIHNHLRPYKKESASFEAVDRGLKLLKKKNIHIQIECTLTPAHLKLGYTPAKLFDFFWTEYRVSNLALAPVAMNDQFPEYTSKRFYEEITPLYVELAEKSLQSMISDEPLAFQQVKYILRYFLGRLRRDDNQFCYTKLGEKLFANTKSGGVYPCQMLSDDPEMKLNTEDSESFQDPKDHKHLQNLNKSENQCAHCWARHLCFMCPAGVYLETGSMAVIPEHRCHFIKSIIEKTLGFCANVQDDPAKLQKLAAAVFR